jgi:hypothetical protein
LQAVAVFLQQPMTFASGAAVEELRQGMIDKNIANFEQVLDSGDIGLEAFSTSIRLYEVACASTAEVYSAFLHRLFEFGVDPSSEDPTRQPM